MNAYIPLAQRTPASETRHVGLVRRGRKGGHEDSGQYIQRQGDSERDKA